ncbi:MAG TPA: hypothetical protein VMS56_00290 [Thermoanaerobaculia bacterium]|nr:hypothetical protein [Thermoanaerobaculia bacterium]
MARTRLLSLRAPAGFAFEPTVRSHGWYLLTPFRWDAKSGTLHRTEYLDGTAADLAIRFSRGTIEVTTAHPTEVDRAALETRLRRMFQLDIDTEEFRRLARQRETHLWVSASGFGRLLCGATRFEDAVKIIATTNTTWRQTMRMVELLVARAGSASPSGAHAFPTPAQIAAIDPAALQEECRLGYRAKTIHALASGIEIGAIDLDALVDGSLDPKEQLERYRSLPGIGPYGAAHLMAMDGRHDFIAVDTEFRRFVRETYHGGRKVSDATLLRRYQRWGRWRYLAYWAELWRGAAPALVKFESGIE